MPDAVSPHEIVSSGLCIGCGACTAEGAARMDWDWQRQLKPVGQRAWMRRRSPSFSRTCPFSPAATDEDNLAAALFVHGKHHAEIGVFLAAYVGYASEGDFRADGSSGGLVSWVAAELLHEGIVDGVAHVVPADPGTKGRLFRYRVSRTPDAVRQGAKSRYYPVEMSAALREMRETPGRYAVVGIPCFIKAVQLQRAEDPVLRERIVATLGLFCGHMKSAWMAESFARQMGAAEDEIVAIDYRRKRPERPANWYNAELTLADGRRVERDWWHLVEGDWGSGFFQNSACDFCDDVTAETADIAFGDAWVEPYASDGRGTNVVVIRSKAMHELIEQGRAAGRLRLDPVDAAFVAETQAAGLRHRREGLAYRLTWPRGGVAPRKRIAAGAPSPALRRKLIYRQRAAIARWSPRVYAAARRLRWYEGYRIWARAVLAVYHALAYERGVLGKLVSALSRSRSGRVRS